MLVKGYKHGCFVELLSHSTWLLLEQKAWHCLCKALMGQSDNHPSQLRLCLSFKTLTSVRQERNSVTLRADFFRFYFVCFWWTQLWHELFEDKQMLLNAFFPLWVCWLLKCDVQINMMSRILLYSLYEDLNHCIIHIIYVYLFYCDTDAT